MLIFSGVTLGYGGKPVVALDDFQLPAGEQCLITGASGSGKTSLLYAIAGLMPLMNGNITLFDTDIASLCEGARDRFRGRHIGVVFQTLHLIPSLDVMQNLLLAPYAAGLEQDAIYARHLLGRLGIADKEKIRPDRLSQGQSQRAAIARALLCKPALLLADEPTSSLDDESCEQVIRLIRDVARETGTALIISTHDSRVKAHFGNIIHLEMRA